MVRKVKENSNIPKKRETNINHHDKFKKDAINFNNTNLNVTTKSEYSEYRGIIPPPNIIDGYEKNCPGATDRILAMAENQLKATQEIDLKNQENINECRLRAIKSEDTYTKIGQISGFFIVMTMLVFGFKLVELGKNIGGYGAIISSIMLGIGSVIWKNKIEKE